MYWVIKTLESFWCEKIEKSGVRYAKAVINSLFTEKFYRGYACFYNNSIDAQKLSPLGLKKEKNKQLMKYIKYAAEGKCSQGDIYKILCEKYDILKYLTNATQVNRFVDYLIDCLRKESLAVLPDCAFYDLTFHLLLLQKTFSVYKSVGSHQVNVHDFTKFMYGILSASMKVQSIDFYSRALMSIIDIEGPISLYLIGDSDFPHTIDALKAELFALDMVKFNLSIDFDYLNELFRGMPPAICKDFINEYKRNVNTKPEKECIEFANFINKIHEYSVRDEEADACRESSRLTM